MNPPPGKYPGDASIDAVFISPHKFIGGPGTPGVLVVKTGLLTNRVPTVPGGGTVSYVSSEDHSYITDPAHREEGGTPAIIESIRAGLVFQLKEAVGAETIKQREEDMTSKAIASWSANPKIKILGNPEAPRLSIVSFLVRHGELFLHHNFVVALLNDLFGIQARGGCACAGPYGHRLLGIDLERSGRFRAAINSGCEGVKPGWVRVNFNYFITDAEFEFILEAIEIIAGLRRDGFIEVAEGEGVYPQLLSFYEVDTEAEQILYDMFMDHRMQTFQGAFHINPDYTTWYGYAKMKQALSEIKELDHQMREWAAAKNAS